MLLRSAFLCFALGLTSQAQSVKRDPLPVADINGFKTLKCDLHMHSVFSDGVVWPETRVHEAWRDGLDCISITDHDDYHPHKATVSTDLSQPFAIAAPTARQLDILLVPGIEITKGDLHVNALFVKDFNATANLPLRKALETARAQGAFLFWNHPGWKGDTNWHPEIDSAHKAGLIQGVEVVNFGKLEPQTLPWIDEKSLTILSNTDIHDLVEIPAGQHRSSITLVFAKTRDLAGIREALDSRRTLAWLHDEVWGSASLLGQFLQASITTRRSGKLIFVQNKSAIPLKVKITGPQGKLLDELVIFGNGETRAELQASGAVDVEVTNFHVTNGKNLTFQTTL